jgi:hypothetical protein
MTTHFRELVLTRPRLVVRRCIGRQEGINVIDLSLARFAMTYAKATTFLAGVVGPPFQVGSGHDKSTGEGALNSSSCTA